MSSWEIFSFFVIVASDLFGHLPLSYLTPRKSVSIQTVVEIVGSVIYLPEHQALGPWLTVIWQNTDVIKIYVFY